MGIDEGHASVHPPEDVCCLEPVEVVGRGDEAAAEDDGRCHPEDDVQEAVHGLGAVAASVRGDATAALAGQKGYGPLDPCCSVHGFQSLDFVVPRLLGAAALTPTCTLPVECQRSDVGIYLVAHRQV